MFHCLILREYACLKTREVIAEHSNRSFSEVGRNPPLASQKLRLVRRERVNATLRWDFTREDKGLTTPSDIILG